MCDYAETVQAMRYAFEQPCYDCVLGEKCNWGDFCFFKRAADAIEELLAAVPKWISVEERLPEENKNYLTYGVFLPLGVKAMDMNRFDGTKWLTSADVEITHWMPLPEAPKEVE